MKRRAVFLTCAMLLIACMACEKKGELPRPAIHEVAERMYASENFRQFTRSFLVDFTSLSDYYRAAGVQNNRAAFIGQLKEAGDDDLKLQAAFSAVSLSFDEAMQRKNRIDNDFLQLFNRERILLKYTETEVWTIIREAIDMGWRSQSTEWQEVRATSITKTTTVRSMTDNSAIRVNKLALDEVWGCIKEAAGVGSASILGIAGLQKLASEGIQAAVITASKWLAQRAGWIGAAILVLDFSACIYAQAID